MYENRLDGMRVALYDPMAGLEAGHEGTVVGGYSAAGCFLRVVWDGLGPLQTTMRWNEIRPVPGENRLADFVQNAKRMHDPGICHVEGRNCECG